MKYGLLHRSLPSELQASKVNTFIFLSCGNFYPVKKDGVRTG